MRFFQNSDCQRHRPARSGGTHFPDVGFGPLQLGLDDSTASSVRARVTNGTGDALELRELLRARRQRQVKRVQGHHLRPRAIALRYQAVKQCLVSFHRARLSTPRFRETHECRVEQRGRRRLGNGVRCGHAEGPETAGGQERYRGRDMRALNGSKARNRFAAMRVAGAQRRELGPAHLSTLQLKGSR